MPFFKRSKPKSGPAVLEAGFRQPAGRWYLETLSDFQQRLKPDWYLEIGTQKGKSLALAKCKAIAIDPEFQITLDVFKALPQLHMFSMTSDDFFASSFLRLNNIRLDFAFLDGMHLFEYLLRDFINAERVMASGGVIAAHDCIPINHLMAERHWDKEKTRHWTGDVWKLLPILQNYRPDLKVSVLDAAPTGLVVISGLDPENTVLQQNMAAILAEWTPKTLLDLGLQAFADSFPFVSEQAFVSSI